MRHLRNILWWSMFSNNRNRMSLILRQNYEMDATGFGRFPVESSRRRRKLNSLIQILPPIVRGGKIWRWLIEYFCEMLETTGAEWGTVTTVQYLYRVLNNMRVVTLVRRRERSFAKNGSKEQNLPWFAGECSMYPVLTLASLQYIRYKTMEC